MQFSLPRLGGLLHQTYRGHVQLLKIQKTQNFLLPQPSLNWPSKLFSTQTRSMSVQIRAIGADDKTTWLGLWEQYNEFYKRTVATEVTNTTFSRFLDDKVRMYGAVAVDPSDGKVIGFVHWYPHMSTSSMDEVVYLHDLFVDPSVRNKGAGRALIEHVYEHAKSIPASSVYWHTQYFNHRAQLLYVKVADRTDFVRYNKVL